MPISAPNVIRLTAIFFATLLLVGCSDTTDDGPILLLKHAVDTVKPLE